MDAGACRQISITFDVEGNWTAPANIDYTDDELDILAAVTGAIGSHCTEL